jgi:hypothetical protein
VGWFIHLLQGVPVWVAGLILAAVGLVVSQLSLFAVGRLFDSARRRRSNEMIGLTLSVVAVIYAVPLALIAGEAWSDFTEARTAAAHEAGEVARTMQLAVGLGPETAAPVRTALTSYAAAVIDQEWPEMTLGRHPSAAAQLLEAWRARLAAGPATPEAVRLLQHIDELSTARAERILAVDEGLIGAIWWLIGVGGVITLIMCAAIGAEDASLHRIACGLVSLVIMSVVLLIIATDRPFHGVPRVPPDAMREVLRTQLAAPS